MKKSIEFAINRNMLGINVEEIKKDDIMYSIFLSNLIKNIDNLCEVHNQDKSEVYEYLGKVLYK